MTKPDFVYTTYIKSTPEKVWQALTTPEFTRQYWNLDNVSDWKKDSEWKHMDQKTGEVRIIGKVIESAPYSKLVLSWAEPENKDDQSHVTFEIEAVGDVTRLNVVHGGFGTASTMAGKVSMGWPLVLSSLKSFLESGKPLDIKACKKSAA